MKRKPKPASEAELIKLLERAVAPPKRATDRRKLVKAMGSVDWSDYRLFHKKIAAWLEKNAVATNGK